MSRRRDNPYAKPDARTLQARKEGYPARSVYKLKEIDERLRLFRQGQRVLDLGAAPGSWTLYASERVGLGGRVLAIDLTVMKQTFSGNVVAVEGDALSEQNDGLNRFAPYDVVLSDMAPRTSGSRFRDQVQSYDLCVGALGIARRLGKPGSSFVAKIFMSGEFPKAKQAVVGAYAKCQVIRPDGTRSNSSEVFLVGMGLRS